jgi:hypothetical protein
MGSNRIRKTNGWGAHGMCVMGGRRVSIRYWHRIESYRTYLIVSHRVMPDILKRYVRACVRVASCAYEVLVYICSTVYESGGYMYWITLHRHLYLDLNLYVTVHEE